jgi:hypothetical protein
MLLPAKRSPTPPSSAPDRSMVVGAARPIVRYREPAGRPWERRLWPSAAQPRRVPLSRLRSRPNDGQGRMSCILASTCPRRFMKRCVKPPSIKHGASNRVASRLQSTPRPRTRQPPARPPAQPQRFSRFVDRPASARRDQWRRERFRLMTQHAQIAERKYCRAHARPFRLRFARVVAVFPVCSPAAL